MERIDLTISTVMLRAQLAQLKREVTLYADELMQRYRDIRVLQQAHEQELDNVNANVGRLVVENRALRHRIVDLESVLSAYGTASS